MCRGGHKKQPQEEHSKVHDVAGAETELRCHATKISSSDNAAAAFERVAAAGRLLPGVDPMRAAVATIALMDGLQVQWLLDPTSTDMAEALAEFFGGMIAGFDMGALERRLDALGSDVAAPGGADDAPAGVDEVVA